MKQWLLLAAVMILIPITLWVYSPRGGAERYPVSGSVSNGNSPIENGTIVFTPESETGVKAVGRIEMGKFKIPAKQGPEAGPYRVVIHAEQTPLSSTNPADGDSSVLQLERIEPQSARQGGDPRRTIPTANTPATFPVTVLASHEEADNHFEFNLAEARNARR